MDIREYILSEAKSGMHRTLALPEWDKDGEKCIVEVRELDVVDRAHWRSLSMKDDKWDNVRSNMALIVLSTYTQNNGQPGVRVFQDEDIEVLLRLPGQKHDVPLMTLLNEVTEVNFLAAGDVKEAQKNSKRTRKSAIS